MARNKYIIPVLLIGGIIMIILGSTFAFLRWISSDNQKTNVTFTISNKFSCSADGGGSITNTNYFVPTDCTNDIYAIKRTITTSITNTGTEPVYMDMWLNIDSIGSGLSNSENFKYALTKSSTNCTTSVVTNGNFYGKGINDKINLIKNNTTPGTYYLWVWLDKEETSTSTMNQSVSLSLEGTCTDQTPETPAKLMRRLAVKDNIQSTNVSSESGIDFSSNATVTNGNGLYMIDSTSSNTNPIYYYRGDVDNNNVYFGGYCWKIVRTTDTGGLKLIYNGTISNGTCGPATTSQSESTTGISSFAISKTVAYNNSLAKSSVTSWYNSHLSSYESYLESIDYCNDQSSGTSGSLLTPSYYATQTRITNGSPTLDCPSNYIISSQYIGLLTTDEAIYAGMINQNSTNYLSGSANPWWTMSPYQSFYSAQYMATINSNSIAYQKVAIDETAYIRPTIALNKNTILTQGDGTTSNPYRLEEVFG